MKCRLSLNPDCPPKLRAVQQHPCTWRRGCQWALAAPLIGSSSPHLKAFAPAVPSAWNSLLLPLYLRLLTLQVSSEMLCSQRDLPDHSLEHTSPLSILFSIEFPYVFTGLLAYLFICLPQLECEPQEDFCSLLYHQQLSPCLAHNRHS